MTLPDLNPFQQMAVPDAQLVAQLTAAFEHPALDDDLQAIQQFVNELDHSQTHPTLSISFDAIQRADPTLADHLLQKPSKTLRLAYRAIQGLDRWTLPLPAPGNLAVVDLPKSTHTPIHQLRAHHVGSLITITGRVTKYKGVTPLAEEVHWECKSCGNIDVVIQDEDNLQHPVMCEACEKTGPIWRLLQDETRFRDYQLVQVEEHYEHANMSRGATPVRITVELFDDQVNTIHPGNQVRIVGIPRLKIRKEGNSKTTKTDVIIQAIRADVSDDELRRITPSQEELKYFEAGVRRQDWRSLVVRSFSAAEGMDDIRLSVLLSLISTAAIQTPTGSTLRGDSHVLIVGDPGLAKSRILKWVAQHVPLARYANGVGSSAAGLTAAAIKDEFGGGGFSLEAGTLVLADKGVALIDELDKMDRNDYGGFTEAMEQQEISISKAGISTTLKSRCPIIAAANPKLGTFDDLNPLIQQVNLPTYLLSRFDLSWCLLTPRHREQRSELLDFVASQYVDDDTAAAPDESMSPEMLARFIIWTRDKFHAVKLTQQVIEHIKEQFLGVVNTGDDEGLGRTFQVRFFEGLLRLARAHAALHWRTATKLEDADAALALWRASLESWGLITETGHFDIDVIVTGVTKSQDERIRAIQDIVKRLASESSKGWAYEDQITEAAADELQLDADTTRKDLATLKRNNSVYAKGGSGTYAPT